MSMFTAIGDIRKERARQDAKWGVQSHSSPFWTVILGEEFGEVCRAIFDQEGDERVREELVQVAAVALAWIEDIDRMAS